MSAPDRTRPPAPGALRPFHFPEVRRHRLGNGLTVIAAEAHAFPVATFDLVVPGGGLGEPPDRAGLAALTSALLESGAAGRGASEIAEAVDALGLALESGIGWDTALAGFTCLRSRVDAGFSLLADLVRRPSFPADEVDRIRDERLSSLAQRRADPGALADELVVRYVFAEGVPFGRRLGGTQETLRTLTRPDVQDFHATRYRPLGATLVAAGDVTLEEAVDLAERHLGDWEGAADPVASPEPEPRLEETTVFLAHRPGSVQSELRVGHPGVARTVDDYFAVTVLNSILGSTFSSRLNMTLRERRGVTYGVHSTWAMRRTSGTFHVDSAVQSEATADSVVEVLREMRAMQASPPTAAELDDARSFLAGVFPLGLQTTDGLAGKLSTIASYDLPDDYYATYRERILDVTAEDVRRAAERRLMPERASVVVVGDADALRPSLEAAGVGPVVTLDLEAVLR